MFVIVVGRSIELVIVPGRGIELVMVAGRGIEFVLDVEGNKSEEEDDELVGGSGSLEVVVSLAALNEDEDESDVGKGKTMTEVEVTPMIVEEKTVVRGIVDESSSDEMGVREDMVVGGADEVGGWMGGFPLRLEELELEGSGRGFRGSRELNEVEGSCVNVSVVVREEVRDVEIVWMEDGDCGGSNEDVSAQVETLDEVSRIVMLDLVLE